jgi:hypothetical protein
MTTLQDLLTLKADMPTPITVTHCGSTSKALDAFEEWRTKDTLHGLIVLTIGAIKSDIELQITPEKSIQLDILHLHKIDKADFVRILNKNNYIGESTQRELDYAKMLDKRIVFLEYHPDMLYKECVSCLHSAQQNHICQFCGFCYTCEPVHIPCEAGYFIADAKLD